MIAESTPTFPTKGGYRGSKPAAACPPPPKVPSATIRPRPAWKPPVNDLLLGGITVVVSAALPVDPSPGQVVKRMVRHGLADVLEWLGEPVGPRPHDKTHAFLMAGDGRPVAMVSAEWFEKVSDGSLSLGHADPDTTTAAEA